MTLKLQVAYLGQSNLFGRVVTTFLRQIPGVERLRLYGCTESLAPTADDGVCEVTAYQGTQLSAALQDADIVVIGDETGAGEGPGREHSRECVLGTAKRVFDYMFVMASVAPKALVVVSVSPLNVILPLAGQILQELGTFDGRKLLGVTSEETFRSNPLLGELLTGVEEATVLPVVGGASPETRVPLFSLARPASAQQLQEEAKQKLISEIKGFDYIFPREEVEAERAYATIRILRSIIQGLGSGGGEPLTEMAMTKTSLVPDTMYFSLPVELGTNGVERAFGLPKLEGIEEELLDFARVNLNHDLTRAYELFKTIRPNQTDPPQTSQRSTSHTEENKHQIAQTEKRMILKPESLNEPTAENNGATSINNPEMDKIQENIKSYRRRHKDQKQYNNLNKIDKNNELRKTKSENRNIAKENENIEACDKTKSQLFQNKKETHTDNELSVVNHSEFPTEIIPFVKNEHILTEEDNRDNNIANNPDVEGSRQNKMGSVNFDENQRHEKLKKNPREVFGTRNTDNQQNVEQEEQQNNEKETNKLSINSIKVDEIGIEGNDLLNNKVSKQARETVSNSMQKSGQVIEKCRDNQKFPEVKSCPGQMNNKGSKSTDCKENSKRKDDVMEEIDTTFLKVTENEKFLQEIDFNKVSKTKPLNNILTDKNTLNKSSKGKIVRLWQEKNKVPSLNMQSKENNGNFDNSQYVEPRTGERNKIISLEYSTKDESKFKEQFKQVQDFINNDIEANQNKVINNEEGNNNDFQKHILVINENHSTPSKNLNEIVQNVYQDVNNALTKQVESVNKVVDIIKDKFDFVNAKIKRQDLGRALSQVKDQISKSQISYFSNNNIIREENINEKNMHLNVQEKRKKEVLPPKTVLKYNSENNINLNFKEKPKMMNHKDRLLPKTEAKPKNEKTLNASENPPKRNFNEELTPKLSAITTNLKKAELKHNNKGIFQTTSNLNKETVLGNEILCKNKLEKLAIQNNNAIKPKIENQLNKSSTNKIDFEKIKSDKIEQSKMTKGSFMEHSKNVINQQNKINAVEIFGKKELSKLADAKVQNKFSSSTKFILTNQVQTERGLEKLSKSAITNKVSSENNRGANKERKLIKNLDNNREVIKGQKLANNFENKREANKQQKLANNYEKNREANNGKKLASNFENNIEANKEHKLSNNKEVNTIKQKLVQNKEAELEQKMTNNKEAKIEPIYMNKYERPKSEGSLRTEVQIQNFMKREQEKQVHMSALGNTGGFKKQTQNPESTSESKIKPKQVEVELSADDRIKLQNFSKLNKKFKVSAKKFEKDLREERNKSDNSGANVEKSNKIEDVKSTEESVAISYKQKKEATKLAQPPTSQTGSPISIAKLKKSPLLGKSLYKVEKLHNYWNNLKKSDIENAEYSKALKNVEIAKRKLKLSSIKTTPRKNFNKLNDDIKINKNQSSSEPNRKEKTQSQNSKLLENKIHGKEKHELQDRVVESSSGSKRITESTNQLRKEQKEESAKSPLRAMMKTEESAKSPLRAMMKTEESAKSPLRAMMKTEESAKSPLRAMMKTEESAKSPLRAMMKTEESAKSPLRAMMKTEESAKSPLRAMMKTEESAKSPLRAMMKTEESAKSPLRAMMKTEESAKSPLRAMMKTEESAKSPLRAMMKTEESAKSPLRAMMKTEESAKSPLRAMMKTEENKTKNEISSDEPFKKVFEKLVSKAQKDKGIDKINIPDIISSKNVSVSSKYIDSSFTKKNLSGNQKNTSTQDSNSQALSFKINTNTNFKELKKRYTMLKRGEVSTMIKEDLNADISKAKIFEKGYQGNNSNKTMSNEHNKEEDGKIETKYEMKNKIKVKKSHSVAIQNRSSPTKKPEKILGIRRSQNFSTSPAQEPRQHEKIQNHNSFSKREEFSKQAIHKLKLFKMKHKVKRKSRTIETQKIIQTDVDNMPRKLEGSQNSDMKNNHGLKMEDSKREKNDEVLSSKTQILENLKEKKTIVEKPRTRESQFAINNVNSKLATSERANSRKGVAKTLTRKQMSRGQQDNLIIGPERSKCDSSECVPKGTVKYTNLQEVLGTRNASTMRDMKKCEAVDVIKKRLVYSPKMQMTNENKVTDFSKMEKFGDRLRKPVKLNKNKSERDSEKANSSKESSYSKIASTLSVTKSNSNQLCTSKPNYVTWSSKYLKKQKVMVNPDVSENKMALTKFYKNPFTNGKISLTSNIFTDYMKNKRNYDDKLNSENQKKKATPSLPSVLSANIKRLGLEQTVKYQKLWKSEGENIKPKKSKDRVVTNNYIKYAKIPEKATLCDYHKLLMKSRETSEKLISYNATKLNANNKNFVSQNFNGRYLGRISTPYAPVKEEDSYKKMHLLKAYQDEILGNQRNKGQNTQNQTKISSAKSTGSHNERKIQNTSQIAKLSALKSAQVNLRSYEKKSTISQNKLPLSVGRTNEPPPIENIKKQLSRLYNMFQSVIN